MLVMTICAISGYSLSQEQCYRKALALLSLPATPASFRDIQALLCICLTDPSVADVEEITVITAISHPLRRRIIDRLLLHGPTQVGTLARVFDAQVGSISHHLRMLQKADVVEHIDDPTGDRRTSWWQLAQRSFTWSTEFDSPADALLAREAQRANVRHHLDRLQRWDRASAQGDDGYGFSTDALAWATSEEIQELHTRLNALMDDWKTGIDREDGQERRPMFFFAHGFPTEV